MDSIVQGLKDEVEQLTFMLKSQKISFHLLIDSQQKRIAHLDEAFESATPLIRHIKFQSHDGGQQELAADWLLKYAKET